jgi:hypothetical protein
MHGVEQSVMERTDSADPEPGARENNDSLAGVNGTEESANAEIGSKSQLERMEELQKRQKFFQDQMDLQKQQQEQKMKDPTVPAQSGRGVQQGQGRAGVQGGSGRKWSKSSLFAGKTPKQKGSPHIDFARAGILCEGELQKKSSGKISRWQTRYFGIVENKLMYSSSREDFPGEAKKAIDLNGITNVKIEKLTIKIFKGSTKFSLMALSSESASMWQTAFKSLTSHPPSESAAGTSSLGKLRAGKTAKTHAESFKNSPALSSNSGIVLLNDLKKQIEELAKWSKQSAQANTKAGIQHDSLKLLAKLEKTKEFNFFELEVDNEGIVFCFEEILAKASFSKIIDSPASFPLVSCALVAFLYRFTASLQNAEQRRIAIHRAFKSAQRPNIQFVFQLIGRRSFARDFDDLLRFIEMLVDYSCGNDHVLPNDNTTQNSFIASFSDQSMVSEKNFIDLWNLCLKPVVVVRTEPPIPALNATGVNWQQNQSIPAEYRYVDVFWSDGLKQNKVEKVIEPRKNSFAILKKLFQASPVANSSLCSTLASSLAKIDSEGVTYQFAVESVCRIVHQTASKSPSNPNVAEILGVLRNSPLGTKSSSQIVLYFARLPVCVQLVDELLTFIQLLRHDDAEPSSGLNHGFEMVARLIPEVESAGRGSLHQLAVIRLLLAALKQVSDRACLMTDAMTQKLISLCSIPILKCIASQLPDNLDSSTSTSTQLSETGGGSEQGPTESEDGIRTWSQVWTRLLEALLSIGSPYALQATMELAAENPGRWRRFYRYDGKITYSETTVARNWMACLEPSWLLTLTDIIVSDECGDVLHCGAMTLLYESMLGNKRQLVKQWLASSSTPGALDPGSVRMFQVLLPCLFVRARVDNGWSDDTVVDTANGVDVFALRALCSLFSICNEPLFQSTNQYALFKTLLVLPAAIYKLLVCGLAPENVNDIINLFVGEIQRDLANPQEELQVAFSQVVSLLLNAHKIEAENCKDVFLGVLKAVSDSLTHDLVPKYAGLSSVLRLRTF